MDEIEQTELDILANTFYRIERDIKEWQESKAESKAYAVLDELKVNMVYENLGRPFQEDTVFKTLSLIQEADINIKGSDSEYPKEEIQYFDRDKQYYKIVYRFFRLYLLTMYNIKYCKRAIEAFIEYRESLEELGAPPPMPDETLKEWVEFYDFAERNEKKIFDKCFLLVITKENIKNITNFRKLVIHILGATKDLLKNYK